MDSKEILVVNIGEQDQFALLGGERIGEMSSFISKLEALAIRRNVKEGRRPAQWAAWEKKNISNQWGCMMVTEKWRLCKGSDKYFWILPVVLVGDFCRFQAGRGIKRGREATVYPLVPKDVMDFICQHPSSWYASGSHKLDVMWTRKVQRFKTVSAYIDSTRSSPRVRDSSMPHPHTSGIGNGSVMCPGTFKDKFSNNLDVDESLAKLLEIFWTINTKSLASQPSLLSIWSADRERLEADWETKDKVGPLTEAEAEAEAEVEVEEDEE